MANTNPLSDVTKLLGGSGANAQSSQLSGQLTTITEQLQQLQTVNQTQIASIEQNTQAVAQDASAKGSSGTSTAKSVGSTIESVLGFGLGLSPLISGLVSLFGGGGGSAAPAPLVPYIAPLPVNATAGISASNAGAFGVDTAAGGLPQSAASGIGDADYGAGAGDGQPVVSGSQQRYRDGGAAGDARIDDVERRDPGGVGWRIFRR